ncbi:MAG: hypothetical protein H7301_13660 [Cryobacterium sp.]|nr:hypothetical protein [Oligoflexia bacterium]
MENSSNRKNDLNGIPVIEGVVLDAEGHVLHDPVHTANDHTKFEPRMKAVWGSSNAVGTLPKVLMGIAFSALLILGLTVAGIALGVLFVGLLGRLFFTKKR